MKRYVLYNYDIDRLATKTVYVDYDDAIDAVSHLSNVVIVAFIVAEEYDEI